MSKLNRKAFKALLTEWRQNFIREFYDTSKEKQKYYFDADKKQIKIDDGDGGDPPEFKDEGGGGGGGEKVIYATWWHDIPRISLIRPEANEIDPESKDYVDPSIKNPNHFFFDGKKYLNYLNSNSTDRRFTDILIDLELQAIHKLVPISNKGNITENNWYYQKFAAEWGFDNFRSYKLETTLIELAECKEDNTAGIKFIPKSKTMSNLSKSNKKLSSFFNSKHNIVVDSIDCRPGRMSRSFYISTLSNDLEGISPFNFSADRAQDLEALREAILFMIEDCGLAYELDVYVVNGYEDFDFSLYETQLDDLDDFEEHLDEKVLEKNLKLLFNKLGEYK